MDKQKLIELIKKFSIYRGDFELASGDKTNFYIDLRPTLAHPEGNLLVGEIVLDQMNLIRRVHRTKEIDSIGCTGLGGQLIAMSAMLLGATRYYKEYKVWILRKPKDHGRKKEIEGHLEKYDNVIIVDDVCTTGATYMRLIDAAVKAKCNIAGLIAVVDRGGKDKVDAYLESLKINTKLYCLINVNDLDV